MTLTPIGVIRASEGECWIELKEPFAAGLRGLQGFGCIQLVWWAHLAAPTQGADLLLSRPYRRGPEVLGVFATRSPWRPNPIALSTAHVLGMDETEGVVRLAWVDCANGTPLLDLKPYHPSADRIEHPVVPAWCRDWPASIEASGTFDWSTVFEE